MRQPKLTFTDVSIAAFALAAGLFLVINFALRPMSKPEPCCARQEIRK